MRLWNLLYVYMTGGSSLIYSSSVFFSAKMGSLGHQLVANSFISLAKIACPNLLVVARTDMAFLKDSPKL